ncbi:hypothetical protein P4U44_18090, partial [Alkalihalobacillus alcalophilus]|nr:hypothetical protein [Alkalihalobacillus alcalophilus]
LSGNDKKFKPKIKSFILNGKDDFLKFEPSKTFQSEQSSKVFTQLNLFQVECIQLIQRFVIKEVEHSAYFPQLIAAHQAKGMVIEASI